MVIEGIAAIGIGAWLLMRFGWREMFVVFIFVLAIGAWAAVIADRSIGGDEWRRLNPSGACGIDLPQQLY